MEIRRSALISGSPERALEIAREAFVFNNFRLKNLTHTSFEVEGPGMRNSHQNPLLGISRAHIDAVGGELTATADLGGWRKMMFGLVALIIGLTVMAVFILIYFPTRPYAPALRPWIGLAPTAPWIIILPLMARWMRRRVEKALETLLANAVAMAGRQ
jgi:hypothetical protein